MFHLVVELRSPEEIKETLLFTRHYAPMTLDSQGRQMRYCFTLEQSLPDFWTLEQQALTCSPHFCLAHCSYPSSGQSLTLKPHRRVQDVVFLKDLVSSVGSDNISLPSAASGETREDNIVDKLSTKNYSVFTSYDPSSNCVTEKTPGVWCVSFIPYKICTMFLNAHVASAVLMCVTYSPMFRWRLLRNIRRKFQRPAACLWGRCESDVEVAVNYLLDIVAVWPIQRIDYAWGWYINHILTKRMLLEEAMAWLSTLGGAHSSLGEYFACHAEKAGEISMKQLKLALQMGDPLTVARCHMFWAYSLMQRGQWHKTKLIVRRVYKLASTHCVQDIRLINMCQSAWVRLQHLHRLHWQKKRAKDNTAKMRGAAAGVVQNGPTAVSVKRI